MADNILFRIDAEGTATDCRKRNRARSVLGRERKTGAIARSEQLRLALRAAAPHRADCVYDVLRGKTVALGDPGLPRVAAPKCAAFGEEIRPRRAMNGTVDATAAEQCRVGGVNDGVHVELHDTRLDRFELARHVTILP